MTSAGRGGGASGGAAGTSAAAGAGSSAGGMTSATAGPPETKPLGYGQETTGGGATTVVKVATMAEMQAAIDAYAGSGGLVLDYTGKFDFSTIGDPCAQWQKDAQIVEIKQNRNAHLRIPGFGFALPRQECPTRQPLELFRVEYCAFRHLLSFRLHKPSPSTF